MKKYLNDVIALAGIVSLFYGLYQYEPRLAFSVVGFLLFTLSIVVEFVKMKLSTTPKEVR